MCGIAGFTGFNNNIELAQYANIVQLHRGPDNQSLWSDDHIAIAHQRLSIIDLSPAANQPFHKADLVIVFNGEIYNYKELQRKLEIEKEVNFVSSSDTEVVIEMYNHFGIKCLDYFIGMFAFAIYNKKYKSLILARDHFGIKPLFYTPIGDGFAFSSELKTLVNIPGFNKTINPKSLISCLNYLWVSGNGTMFNDCYKLPPAHYLIYNKQNKIEPVRYWELSDELNNDFKMSEKVAAEEISKTIQASVRRHMVADVPVSSFLSGGLDSSLIAVLAKKVNANLSTYTISTFKKDRKIERMPDDEYFADLVAAKYHFDQHKIKVSPDMLKDFPAMVRTLDEPIGDPAAINTFLICKAARDRGVKVLLSGMGADEIFFGYRRQKAILMTLNYNKLPNLIKTAIYRFVNILPVRILGKGFKFGRWAKRFMSFATLPVEQAYMRSYSYYDTNQLRELLHPDYWPTIELIKHEHKEVFDSKYKKDIINRICNTDINMFMTGLNLTYTDRASMAASVEVRVPFIDKLVITKAMQLPGSFKIKNGKSKYILKKAAEEFLPRRIIYRQKASFGAPIRSWISNDLKVMINELLSEDSVKNRGLLNFEFINRLIENDRNGIEDNAYQIYQLLTLELWCREYMDNCNINYFKRAI